MNAIFHAMALPVAAPLVGGVICLLIPRRAEGVRSTLAALCAAGTLVLVWPLFAAPGGALELAAWLSFRVDALSAFVLLAIALLGFLIALYSAAYMKGRDRHREYFAYLLWTIGAACGAVLANELVLLLVCWGFLALTLYLMIGIAGPSAADAAQKSLLIVGGSDAVLVLGVVLVWSLSGSTRMDGGALPLDGPAAYVAFLTFVIAAFAKAGAVPLHSWVPDCGEKADAPVTAFLPASLDKLLGIYLLARCVLDLFAPTPAMNALLMLLGAVTILAPVMLALVQHDLKRLLSYHAVSQVGYMVLGIGTGTPIGVAGGLFHMLNHAIYKSCLFLGAGAVEQATGTTDLDRLGGLARMMPLTFAASLIAALSISGIPPLNGFASKWMVFQGVIDTAAAGGFAWVFYLAAAMLGSALTLASFAKVLHAVFLCKPAPGIARRDVREAAIAMVAPMLVLAALCVLFGVFAHGLPLTWLVFPAIEAEVAGVWWSGLATILIGIGIAVGLVLYAIAMWTGKVRRVGTYIGGEHLDEVRIHGAARGPERHVEVTGVDFYATIEQVPGLRRFYRLAGLRVFDVHALGARLVGYFIGFLRKAHTGVLPVYLTWALVGSLALIYAILQLGR